jgi:hypothetical protein
MTTKPMDALTAQDFERHPIWYVDIAKADIATPAQSVENVESDSPYAVSTEYVFRDGKKAQGFCFVYDSSGFKLFPEDGSSMPLSDYSTCSSEEATRLAKRLNRRIETIFPIQYRAAVKVFGSVVAGEITLQPNPSLQGGPAASGRPLS